MCLCGGVVTAVMQYCSVAMGLLMGLAMGWRCWALRLHGLWLAMVGFGQAVVGVASLEIASVVMRMGDNSCRRGE